MYNIKDLPNIWERAHDLFRHKFKESIPVSDIETKSYFPMIFHNGTLTEGRIKNWLPPEKYMLYESEIKTTMGNLANTLYKIREQKINKQ